MQALWTMTDMLTIFQQNWLQTPHIRSLALTPILNGQVVTPECLQNTSLFSFCFFSSPPSSLCTHSEARNSWRRDSKVKTLDALAFVELKHKLLVWDILSRLNTNKRLNGIQSKLHLCRFSLLSVSTAALHGNIQSELVCTKNDASKGHLFFFLF